MTLDFSTLALAAAGMALAVLLGWAALERGLIHRRWVRGRRAVESVAALPAADWWVTIDVVAGYL